MLCVYPTQMDSLNIHEYIYIISAVYLCITHQHSKLSLSVTHAFVSADHVSVLSLFPLIFNSITCVQLYNFRQF